MSKGHLQRQPWSYLNQSYHLLGFEESLDPRTLYPLMLSNVDFSLANAIRRICIGEVPTLAFAPHQIQLLHNQSQYNLEVLIDRLGFIIINTDYIEQKQWDPSNLVFTLSDLDDTSQPLKNTGSEILLVTIHKHLQVFYQQEKQSIAEICPYDSLLMTLRPNEEIHVTMVPTMGRGRDHCRWNSSWTMYKFVTNYDLSETPPEFPESLAEQQKYLGVAQKHPEAFILTIESIGRRSAIHVLELAINVFIEKLQHLQTELTKGDIFSSPSVIIEMNSENPGLAKIKLINEDHTLGHVLEHGCWLQLDRLANLGGLSPENKAKLLFSSMIFHRQVHPLDNFIELTINIPDQQIPFPPMKEPIPSTPIHLLQLTVESLIDLGHQLQTEFQTLSH